MSYSLKCFKKAFDLSIKLIRDKKQFPPKNLGLQRGDILMSNNCCLNFKNVVNFFRVVNFIDKDSFLPFQMSTFSLIRKIEPEFSSLNFLQLGLDLF